MFATKIVCPQCSKALKAAQPLAVGKKVLCKQCGTTFRVSPNDATAAPVAANQSVPLAAMAGDDEPIATEVEGGRFAKMALVALVLTGGVLFLSAGNVLALFYAVHKDHAQASHNRTMDNDESSVPEEDYSPPGEQQPFHQPTDEPPAPAAPRLPLEEQAKVNDAIAKGVEYVRKMPTNWGASQHGVGQAALRGLALLECGVKKDDPAVQAAVKYIREKLPTTHETYNVSLALLFLDRFEDPADHEAIQSLALRLVAGQLSDGGWNYHCGAAPFPYLTKEQEKELLGILIQARPQDPLELFTGPDGRVLPEYVVTSPGEQLPIFVSPGDSGNSGNPTNAPRARSSAGDLAKATENASPKVKSIPALQPPGTPFVQDHRKQPSDNSNTQFAILAVWVAQRHGVPMERTLALLVKRFRTSQDQEGVWGYHYQRSPGHNRTSSAMICAGLLGLGAGYGMTAGSGDKKANKPGVQDEGVIQAFKALEKAVGTPNGNGAQQMFSPNGVNLYFLWSLERVGVMYNLTKIGDKDWYRWGAEVIVAHQKPNGSWTDGTYPGGLGDINHVDSCFALLFLTRANLAKDLSKKLEYIIDVKDIGNR
jgi:hypothetical protein